MKDFRPNKLNFKQKLLFATKVKDHFWFDTDINVPYLVCNEMIIFDLFKEKSGVKGHALSHLFHVNFVKFITQFQPIRKVDRKE